MPRRARPPDLQKGWMLVLVPSIIVAGADFTWHMLFPHEGGFFPWPSVTVLLVLALLATRQFSWPVVGRYERRHRAALQATSEIARLNATLSEMRGIEEAGRLASEVLQGLGRLFGVTHGAVWLREPESGADGCDQHYRLQASRGFAQVPESLDGGGLPESILGRVAREAGLERQSVVSLRSRRRQLGLMLLGSAARQPGPKPDPDPLGDDALLEALGNHIGAMLDNLWLLQQSRRRQQEAEALRHLSVQISGLLDQGAVLQSVVDHARNLLQADVAVLCLSADGRRTDSEPTRSGPADAFVPWRSGNDEALPCWSWLAASPGVVVFGEDGAPPCTRCPAVRPEFLRSHLATLLRAGTRPVGALCVGSARDRRHTAGEQALLSGLSAQAAISIENARLYRQAQRVAVLEERERLAREMHDTVAQVLGFLTMRTRAMLTQVGAVGSAGLRLRREIGDLAQAADRAYSDVREAILGLRTSVSCEAGLLSTLRKFLEGFEKETGIRTSLQVTAGAEHQLGLSATEEIQTLRIIQESLNNVRKHAHARSVAVRFGLLAAEGGAPFFEVEDDGVGFDFEAVRESVHKDPLANRFGLLSLEQRAARLGGRLRIDSSPGRGTLVRVLLAPRSQVPVPASPVASMERNVVA